MQHHPGSWYLPWGVPLQKMLAVPFQHPAAVAYASPQSPTAAAVPCPVAQSQHCPNSPQAPNQSYPPHQIHAAVALHRNSNAALHPSAAAAAAVARHQHPHPHSHHPQNMHPAAAAALFTPMSLGTFLASSSPHLAGLAAAQQTLTPCGTVHQQNHLIKANPSNQNQSQLAAAMNLNVGVITMRQSNTPTAAVLPVAMKKIITQCDKEKLRLPNPEKRKADENDQVKDLKKAKLETKALKAKRPGFTDERYHETSYFIENGLRKVYPYYFTFTTFTKGRWVGEKILDVFAREFRAHPAEEYERCINAGTLTVNYDKVPIDYRLKHNDLLANIVHRHEVPVTSQPITIVHMDEDIVVVNKPASIPVHPCGRYRHNTVVFILAKEYNLKNLRTIHRLDRLTSGLLLFGRSPKKARQMEHQIRNRQVQKEYICRVEGEFPEGVIECKEPIEVVSYKIGVCKVSPKGKDCTTTFQKIAHNGKTSVVLCKPLTGRMHQIRVHLQYLGYPVVNDPLYNHEVFGPLKGRGGDIGGKTDEQLVRDLINIHNAENWLGIDGDSELSLFKSIKADGDVDILSGGSKGILMSDDDSEIVSRETSPCSESPRPVVAEVESINDNTTINISSNIHVTTTTNDDIAVESQEKVTVATQTGHECPDMAFNAEKMTTDKHCYECKVRYRDPKPKDLVMYLHAWKYKGPGWEYETELPEWAGLNWEEATFE
ncbi:pseudouridylate synthase RPUSD2-like isoform X1 [Eupeodes corollae]|uniref:pseudouridylate synthase RPUSD2-like isoform X1 n=1 Tax=Eupeodes corollae TaxID=290404 RepID=UPI00248FD96A|nr:pseudouridylate synthase RPUSD2-like isoform X1 [Eupeodes corollae]XP_055921832.1 pseudouridylate synthase RPUSD2-like isoform X1 [Eupeodes corollae]XP_055921833.1 pseudouridylate synthase RPUSD2-like isoform X1 [Eupeodes corollae]XP_055921834.1 pseudouridylate synthase RPUSD2-like isoform X1 [Eupeodes corollae]